MDPEELRAQAKKWAIVASFFALALVFYLLNWRTALVAYVIAVGLVAVLAILIQAGRGGGLAASLGGVGADSLLGTHSASPIARATYVLLALFFFLNILAARMGVGQNVGGGFMPEGPARPEAPAPAPGGARPVAPTPASPRPVAPAPTAQPGATGTPPANAEAQPQPQPEEAPAND